MIHKMLLEAKLFVKSPGLAKAMGFYKFSNKQLYAKTVKRLDDAENDYKKAYDAFVNNRADEKWVRSNPIPPLPFSDVDIFECNVLDDLFVQKLKFAYTFKQSNVQGMITLMQKYSNATPTDESSALPIILVYLKLDMMCRLITLLANVMFVNGFTKRPSDLDFTLYMSPSAIIKLRKILVKLSDLYKNKVPGLESGTIKLKKASVKLVLIGLRRVLLTSSSEGIEAIFKSNDAGKLLKTEI